LYLARTNAANSLMPTPIRSVLLAVVDDLQLLDTKTLSDVKRIIDELFGQDLSLSISVDLGRKGEVVVSTTRELSPLVKLRSSQLKSQLELAGITGEIRIVGRQKAPDGP
jgi:hypothetical protein